MISYLKLGIGAAVLAALVGAGWTLNGWRLSGKIEKLEGKVATLTQQKTAAEATSGAMGAAVEKWKASAAEQQKRAEVAEGRAQEARVEWRERTVYTQPPPAPPDETCPQRGALKWLVAEYEALRSSW